MEILNIVSLCTGCSACKNICPVNSIKMENNDEGFLYPTINFDTCIKCNKCRDVCPALKPQDSITINPKAYYGWHKSSLIRKLSSSGGVFSCFAERFINSDGIVFGAIFDYQKCEVLHAGSDTNEYKEFRRSKYAESNLLDSFTRAKNYLDSDVPVLFSATPCQIAGLKSFLGQEYEKLFTIDFICHGISPMLFLREHIEEIKQKFKGNLTEINFRSKRFGWSKKAFSMYMNFDGKKYFRPYFFDSYLNGYLSSKFFRQCCYECKYVKNHTSDVTIADFWGINEYNPDINDKKGISLIIPNTVKGDISVNQITDDFNIFSLDFKYASYVYNNRYAKKSALNEREQFFEKYKVDGFEKAAKKTYMKNNILKLFSVIFKMFIRKIKILR